MLQVPRVHQAEKTQGSAGAVDSQPLENHATFLEVCRVSPERHTLRLERTLGNPSQTGPSLLTGPHFSQHLTFVLSLAKSPRLDAGPHIPLDKLVDETRFRQVSFLPSQGQFTLDQAATWKSSLGLPLLLTHRPNSTAVLVY